MKPLPTVSASPQRQVGILIEAFDGAGRIPNRDVVAFHFDVRLAQRGGRSRIAVWFSGTAMSVRPQAFGLPTIDDRDSAMRTFAEAAIGDYLDGSGLPEFASGDMAATRIDCFSPSFQSWRDREPASDDAIEQYLTTHAIWSWKFGLPAWSLGPSDLLRLGQPVAQIMRIVRLYDGEAWTMSKASASGATITPTPQFLRSQQVVKRSPEAEQTSSGAPVPPEISPAQFVYVDEARISALRQVDHGSHDLTKLIALCEELNQCYRGQCYHAVAALTRAVMDHVPPIFAQRTFAEVANNYKGARSFKEVMQRLDESARKIADAHLHTLIRDREVLPTRVQVNFSNDVDVLLAEILRLLQPKGDADPRDTA